MKKILRFALMLVGTLSLAACGGDDEPEPLPTETMTLTAQTIAEGAEVDASAVNSLTLTYSKMVALGSGAITVNGTGATPSISGFKLTIPLSLIEGQSYTINVPAGAIVASLSKSITASAFTLHFTTKAAEPVVTGDMKLSDSQATDKTKELYQLFLNNYGKNIFTSSIANVNWNNDNAEKVYKLTGKYPAINCYDFIHIYVPKNNWIDYTDITPVKTWSNQGGIVALMWHFNVPKTETTTPGTDGSGVTCTPSETTFKASNALKEGTWENKWFYGQMDKVCDVLLQLQSAGIAATWRPFHEAAGNTYATGWKGSAWFWWGTDGAETFKSLWSTMYSYFQQKGIHNLIWIWTAQNTNAGTATSDKAFYPGSDYVDIVARDYYGNSQSALVEDYEDLKAAYPNKLITLGECGYGDSGQMPNMSDLWSAGGKFLYAMPWYGGKLTTSTNSMVSDDWWKNFMSMENAITR